MTHDQARNNAIGFGYLIVLLAIIAAASGCSFKVETGWHGHTGRDDRYQTQLVRDGDEAQVRRAGKY